jgi:DNA-binding NtrC family response regulator
VQGTRGGTERVLFVEDDGVVVRLVSRILRAHGYTVLAANRLEAARALATSNDFDVLVSDVRLPDGDGAQFAAELRDARPKLPVLLISGFVDDEARATIATRGFAFLAKPFGAEALARSLRAAIDGE